ncbi:hypothetical protein PR003_g14975 [Phytophthora rubi]|uniref:Uncharacterized protein n=1 Tax=Phytophthora rubi TaxID=129364 RepID=A0A6A3KZ97_9STRA|nr:hypothetical protein PR002_g14738 [Phytophthora rubi]KAE9019037.1 hypothetical protein PR001_g13978 [Phytophthora rubi]KAE9331510.1 hypothetical protein PR003_g14975 [Phytophthora rubi]
MRLVAECCVLVPTIDAVVGSVHMWVFHPGKHQGAGGFPTVVELSPRGCPRQLRQ